jgi:FkbM family methyltransferase
MLAVMVRQVAIALARLTPRPVKDIVHNSRFLYGLTRKTFGFLTSVEHTPIVIEAGPMQGLRLASSEHLSHAHLSGQYETETQCALDSLLEPGFVCYDLGASIGYLSLLMARRARHVYAFEPAPHAAVEIRRNMEVNGFSHFTIVESPVSDSIRSVKFGLTDVAFGSGIAHAETRWPTIELTTVTLDGFAMTNDYPDLIKIDVEGEEARVLRGASGILTRCKPRLLVELHSLEVALECTSILREHGYRLLTPARVPFEVPAVVTPGEVQIIALPE